MSRLSIDAEGEWDMRFCWEEDLRDWAVVES
jgi:hypothetical protein